MTHQQIYNRVKGPLIQQHRRSMLTTEDPGGFGDMCGYRGQDGCKCALGHLIPDELYDPSIEGGSLPTNPDKPCNERSGKIANIFTQVLGRPLTKDDCMFLRALQEVHDTTDEDEEQAWREALERFARKEHLKP